MGILDGFEDVCRKNRNDGMYLKIRRKSFTFAMAACHALQCDRIKVKYNSQRLVIALVPCDDTKEGVKVNQKCATVVNSKDLWRLTEPFLTKYFNAYNVDIRLHGEFKEVTENGKPIRAIFFNLTDAKIG